MTAILIFIRKVSLCLLLLGTRESGLDKVSAEIQGLLSRTFKVHANSEVDWGDWDDWSDWDSWDDWED